MQITRQADYAVRALLYLAQQRPDQRISTAQVGREQKIPISFLAKIVSQLATAGVVGTTRGAHGGVRLAQPAETLSLLEVVKAIDGSSALNACVLDPAACQIAGNCPVRAVWCEAYADLVRRLAQTTFGQLACQAQHGAQLAATATPL